MPPILSPGDGRNFAQVSALPEWRVKKRTQTVHLGYFGAPSSSVFLSCISFKEVSDMLEMRILSPLAKVFPNRASQPCAVPFEGLRNETVSFQLAFRPERDEDPVRPWIQLQIDSPIREYLRVRRVKRVPVRLGRLPFMDDNYLNEGAPGLYPDPLTEIPPHGIRAIPGVWESLWLDFVPNGDVAPGEYPIHLRFVYDETDETVGTAETSIRVINAMLPEQTLIHTKWLHTDCLASYYGVEIFSEEYWRIVENFVRCAVSHGINAILTPIHTPPLDTRIRTYRPTVQLVDVYADENGYRFGFDKLVRWVEMCSRCGVEYYELAHLFSQWGAKYAPQIVAETPQGKKRIFGWDTDATGEKYAEFMRAYLPAVIGKMKELGVDKRCLFHISDEPSGEHLAGYLAAKAIVKPFLEGYKVIDALHDVSFYDSGVVEHPVPATNAIEPFLERNIPDLWAYYCIGQGKDVSNLFVAMPGARTRVLGAQLFKFNIEGFLQWGFNFYYSQNSDYLINPWLDTDNDGFTPAGDAYQVYPGAGGQPVDSIRLMLIDESLQDLRAMQLLESLIGRAAVIEEIDRGISPIRFNAYPHDEYWMLDLRRRINRAIEEHI